MSLNENEKSFEQEETLETTDEVLEETVEDVVEEVFEDVKEEITEEAEKDEDPFQYDVVYTEDAAFEVVALEEAELDKKSEPKGKNIAVWVVSGLLAIVAVLAIVYFGFIRDVKVSDDTVVAKVGDQNIYAYEISYMMLSANMSGETLTVEQAAEFMSDYKVMAQIAEENDIVLGEENLQSVQDQITEMESYYGGKEMFDQMLIQCGVTREQFAKIGEMSELTGLVNQRLPELGLVAPTTDDELKTYYDEYYLRAKHILFMNQDEEGNPIDDAVVSQEANDVYEKIKAGQAFEDFESLNDDPGSATSPDGYMFINSSKVAETSPDMVAVLQGQSLVMVPEFEAGTLALQNGEVSAPVKSSFGYHIIKRLDINENETFFENEKEMVKNIVDYTKWTDFINEMKEKYPVKIKKRTMNSLNDLLAAKQEAANKSLEEMQKLYTQQFATQGQ